ncbi:hypothetical protein GWI33_012266 [Rhynchophorus ferrugineus]|uniref:Uncharacterized protein n=1 Tax=Rhynchophorus ferrugineus TaxID=354439 RepID=A0A834IBL1_RHYFE|nr:hypothetical protein GWI33_012266 [Rhynchophorus ferrugineus]
MYGTTLKLPVETFRATESKIERQKAEAEFVKKLKSTMRKLKPVEATNHAKERSYVNAYFLEVPFVFVRGDPAKTPLSPLYEGPFKVLHREEKYFKIDKNGKEDQESQIYGEHSYCKPSIRPIL